MSFSGKLCPIWAHPNFYFHKPREKYMVLPILKGVVETEDDPLLRY